MRMGNIESQGPAGFYKVHSGMDNKNATDAVTYHATGSEDPKNRNLIGRDVTPIQMDKHLYGQPNLDSDEIDLKGTEEIEGNTFDEHRFRVISSWDADRRKPDNSKRKEDMLHRQDQAKIAEEKTRILPKQPDNIYN